MKLIFCSDDTSYAKFVHWADGSEWNHVGIQYFNPTFNEDRIVEAYENVGVRDRTLDGFIQGHAKTLTVEVPVPDETKLWPFLQAQLGLPYDNLALVGCLFNRNWTKAGKWICSGLAMAAIQASGGQFTYPSGRPGVKASLGVALGMSGKVG